MDQQDPVIACLHRLEADNRRMKLVGATALGLLALGLFAAMAWQQDTDTVAVRNIVRTQRLELTNAEGKVVAVLSVVNQDEEIVTRYYDDGLKRFQVPVVNNKYHGLYRAWSRSGLKTQEGDFKEGVRHGLWREWHSRDFTTILKRQGAYADGFGTGIWTTWHRNGQKQSEGEYVGQHRMAGDWKFWNEDGSINEKKSGFYENDLKIR